METKILDLYEGQILPWQRQVRDDQHRFKVLVAGRKARKTTFIINRLTRAAMMDPQGLTYPYVAPFRKQAKEIVWEDHLGRIKRLCAEYGIKTKVNESELTIRFEGRGKLHVTGADNAEALRGKSDWGGIGLDEYATWRPYVWQEIIRPNLQVHRAPAIFGGTPKGYNHFYQIAKLGDHNHVIDDKPSVLDPEFMTFHATSYDNIFLDPEEIESAKRNSTIDFFNQEYLALFTRFTGLVYPEFDISKHVIDFEHEFNKHGDYYFGQDFAVRGWTAALPGYVDTDGDIWILDNYKVESETARTHGAAEKEMLGKYATLSRYTGYADPAGFAKNQQKGDMIWAIADEYIEDGLPLVAANNDVTAGINFVRQLFKSNKIHIHPRCTQLIDELLQYQWKEQPERQQGMLDEVEKVRKINDHLVDALRYMVYSKPVAAEQPEVNTGTVFPIKFPPPRIETPDDDEDHITPIDTMTPYDN